MLALLDLALGANLLLLLCSILLTILGVCRKMPSRLLKGVFGPPTSAIRLPLTTGPLGLKKCELSLAYAETPHPQQV
eukprot:11180210-Lingulodinium_polyedra.AAC.1